MPTLRKPLSALIFLVVIAATVGVLAYSIVDYRGRATWDRTKKELLAKGEPLSLTEQIPPDVPSDQNFFTTPVWTKIFNSDEPDPFDVLVFQGESLWKIGYKPGSFLGRGEPAVWDLDSQAKTYREKGLATGNEEKPALVILEALSRADTLSSEIEKGAELPYARAPIDYPRTFETRMPPHISKVLTLAQYYGHRAVARMAAGDPHGAAKDIQLMFKLCKAISGEPFLISKLVGNSAASLATFSFWNCNAQGIFSETDLAAIQKCFQDFSALRNIADGFRGERGMTNEWLAGNPSAKELSRMIDLMGQMSSPEERLAKFSPTALIFYPRGYLLDTQSEINLATQRVIDTLLHGKIGDLSGLSMRGDTRADLKHTLLKMLLSSADSTAGAAFELQNQLNLAIVACALERYRLKNGKFPDSLHALVPDFLAELPNDLLSGAPLGYRLTAADNYELTCHSAKPPGDQRRPKNGLLTWMRLPPRATQ